MSTAATPEHLDILTRIADVIGADAVLSDGKRIRKYLRDFSWYSPVLDNALSDTTVDAVIKPKSVQDLTAVVSLAAEYRIPITLRGAGTGNYGQSLPLERGLVIDIKGIAGVLDIGEGRVTVLPGSIMKSVEEAANATGQELAVMPSTYRVATASGFVSGGSGGLGGARNGDLWSGNILAVEFLTVEEQPRTIRFEGDDVFPLLHTYGTVGVITEIEMRLVPRRDYDSVIVSFTDFADALRFGWEVTRRPVDLRLSSVHQAPLGSMFTPIADAYDKDAHVALIWFDAADRDLLNTIAEEHGGVVIDWPAGASHISQFPYSHTVLWSKRAEPESSWLQCEYAVDDKERIVEQASALSERYPGIFVQHVEFNVAPTGGIRTKGIPSIIGLADYTAALDEMIAFCDGLGIRVQNPHSYVVEEGGFVGDTSGFLELKRTCDPFNLLNPGKIGSSFFDRRAGEVDPLATDFSSPEQLGKITNVTSV